MANTGDILQIDTPENVSFDYDVAGIGSRFLAATVDTILIGLGIVIIVGVAILFGSNLGALNEVGANWLIAITSSVIFLLFWGYYILFEIFWNGQTPGKRWVKIRVIRLDGTPVTAAEVVIRNLVRIIDLLPIAYALGVVCMFANNKSRRLGDLAAGTLVVHEREVQLVQAGPSRERVLSTVIAEGEAPENFPVERLDRHDMEIIEEFLMRRAQLPNQEQLARNILASFYSRLGLPENAIPSRNASDVLAALYKKIQASGRADL